MGFEIVPKKSYPIAAKIQGQGPGKYMLPTAVGFNGHTLTKFRYPAFTMCMQLKIQDYTCSPGPIHAIGAHMMNVGKVVGPSWIIGRILPELRRAQTPGPADYTVLPDVTRLRSPAWMMGLPGLNFKPNTYPGPNHYKIPAITGSRHPCIETPPHFTMRPKLLIGGPLQDKERSPGPAVYGAVPLERIKLRSPIWSMRQRLEPLKIGKIPSPSDYFPGLDHKERSPAFTMRIKHSEYKTEVKVDEPEYLLDWDC